MKKRMVRTLLWLCLLVPGLPGGVGLGAPASSRWTEEQAWNWQREREWLAGFNYVPSTACNTTEWWQRETFDPATIDRELGWAGKLGFNSTRAFIQYLVWKQDPEGFKQRLGTFLELAAKHDLTVMPVLFDDCTFGDPPQMDPVLGKQREPIPGMILPSWTPSPGRTLMVDPAEKPALKHYVQDLLRTFGGDQRVAAWDLYNEPMNVAGMGTAAFLRELFGWAREVRPSQPLTVSVWNDNRAVNAVMLAESDIISYHLYSDLAGQWRRMAEMKAQGRPVVCTEWMARLQGSRWDPDLALFKAEGVGCYSWGLVNGRTQCQFAWYHKRGTAEPKVWFHDLFRADGRPYDAAEHEVIRTVTANKRLAWAEADFREMRTPAPAGASSQPRLKWADASRNGRRFSKDPAVIRFGGRYLLYYSMPPATNTALPPGWAIGIAESRDLVSWTKAGELLPSQPCDAKGLCAPDAIVLDGKVHLFYQTYGNGPLDAICHAVSGDGLSFTRDASNPVFRPSGTWTCGRAIDADVFPLGDRLLLYFATRDPAMKIQMIGVAGADLKSDYSRKAWKQLGDGPILKPELPWETRCIEAPTVCRRGETLVMFYAGGYNNDPQQVGVATSKDGVRWTRLMREPLLPNGQPGDWNSSESGHPGIFEDGDGRSYLFFQGNPDKGRTWFLSAVELGWRNERPYVIWDSGKFPTKRPGPAPHREDGMDFSAGWTCWTGEGPRGGGLHYNNAAGGTATIEFEGPRLALIHKAGPDCGIAQIEVDGQLWKGPEGSSKLDTFNPTVEWNRVTPIASDLPGGRHTVMVKVTGQHNTRSSDSYVQLVGYEATFDEKKLRQWTLQGPLGDSPRRTNDLFPLSDQANRGGWVKVGELSDEFEEAALDTNKWNVGMSWWKGRQPALFSPKNVTVSGGQLHLAMRKETLPAELAKQGYTNYTSAALHTRARAGCGYYEVKARAMASAGSSSFWFQQEDRRQYPGWATEVDVFELCGKSPKHDQRYYMTLHVTKTPAETRHWQAGTFWTAPWRFSADFHVFGFDWGQDALRWYVDGVLVRTVQNTHWHQPLHLIFDSETMPEWFGLPDDADLPSTFSVEYVRAWRRTNRTDP